MKIRIISILFITVILSASVLIAQEKTEDVVIAMEGGAGMPEHVLPPPAHGNFIFMSLEMGMEDKLVRGAPYSAEVVTERVQTLSDGNRIVQKDTATVYRDGQGRTRREQELGMIGTWKSSGDEKPKLISVYDPVKNEHFTLEPDTKTAYKAIIEKDSKHQLSDKEFQIPVPPGGKTRGLRYYREAPESKTEALGRQVIEGLAVEGKRTVSVIPAGDVGNESPIEIVSERWYSPDLQIHILTRHSDPRFGETVYRVTNIRRSEPTASLFEIPKDYKIEKSSPRIMMKHKVEIKD